MKSKIPFNSFFFIQLLILCFFLQSSTVLAGLFHKYEVKIANDLPDNTPPLMFRCQSRDDDLGTRNLTKNNEWHWDFRKGFTTLYFCSFYWSSKYATFDVFNGDISGDCEGNGRSYCYWSVQEDGFYFSNLQNPSPQDLMYYGSWN